MLVLVLLAPATPIVPLGCAPPGRARAGWPIVQATDHNNVEPVYTSNIALPKTSEALEMRTDPDASTISAKEDTVKAQHCAGLAKQEQRTGLKVIVEAVTFVRLSVATLANAPCPIMHRAGTCANTTPNVHLTYVCFQARIDPIVLLDPGSPVATP